MPEENGLFNIHRCFLCGGYGRIAIVDPANLFKLADSRICPICNGKGFLKVRKNDYGD